MVLRRCVSVLALALGLMAPVARAEAPLAALRPVARPVVAVAAPVVPPARPDGLGAVAVAVLAPPSRPVVPVLTSLGLSTRQAPAALPGWARIEALLDGGPASAPAPVVRVAAVAGPFVRPLSRPVPGAVVPAVLIVPPSRPGLQFAEDLAQVSRVALVVNPVSLSPMAVPRAVLPPVRPEQISMRIAERTARAMRGAVCGDPAIQGEVLGNVPGPGSCGVQDAVLVRSVGGLVLSEPATIDCATARALAKWVEDGALAALPGIERIETMGTYSCRGRNGRAGARLSEHAFGRAVDIGGFTLRDGTRVSLLNDWGGGRYGQALRAMHRAACGTFGTVLGPEANAYHRNHFHFDTARYRSGSYCE